MIRVDGDPRNQVRHPKKAGVSSGSAIDWAVRRDPMLLEAAIEVRPTVVSVSFGHD